VIRGGLACFVIVVAGCTPRGVRLDVDARAVPPDTVLRAAVYVDDGGGCAAWRFAVAPALTPIDVGVLPADVLDVPREGDKLIVVDALDLAGRSVGRACVVVGVVDEVVAVTATLLPTVRVVVAGESRQVLGRGDAIVVDVQDGTGAPVAGRDVAVRVTDGNDVVLTDVVVASDSDGRVVFRPEPGTDGRGLGLLRASFRGAEPFVDGPVDVAVLRAPATTNLLGDAPRVDPRPVVLGDDLAFVVGDDQGAGFALLTPGEPPVPLAPGQLGGARFLGAFAGDGGLLLFAAGEQLIAVDVRGSPLDARPVRGADFGAARALAAGSCAARRERPVLVATADAAWLVDVRFGALVVLDAPAALPRDVLATGCVVDDAGARHRILFGPSGSAGGPVSLGDGLAQVEDLSDLVVEPLAVPPDIVHFSVREDGVVLAGAVDGGEVVLRPLVRRGAALVDRDGDVPFRLPSPPLLVQQGAVFGGDRDVLALLDLSTAADGDASALYAVQGGLAVGTTAVCRPLAACAQSVFVDGDGDGRLDLLTSSDGVPRLVRFAP
jgi:hypothetical protein